MSEYDNKLYGLYRAIVVDNKDPEKRGRVKIYCPSIMNEYLSSWCVPCKNLASTSFELPSIQSPVWVMFEEGDVNKPVYMGGWWIANSSVIDSKTVNTQALNWGTMVVQPKLLPVKDLNGNLENYFGYKTPFGGVYWKQDYDNSIHVKLDCADGGDLTLTANGSNIIIDKNGNITISAKGDLHLNGAHVYTHPAVTVV